MDKAKLLELLMMVGMVVGPLLASWLVALILKGLAALANRLAADSSHGARNLLLGKLVHFAEVVVVDLNATLKPELKAATEDGQISKAELLRLRNLAIERVKALLSEHGLKELQGVLGIAGSELDGYLGGVVEQAVNNAKNPQSPQ